MIFKNGCMYGVVGALFAGPAGEAGGGHEGVGAASDGLDRACRVKTGREEMVSIHNEFHVFN